MYLKKILPIVAIFLALAIYQTAQASGKLYARFPNRESSPVFNLQLKKFKVDVTIQDQLAVVHLDETFYNSQNQRMEGIYFLELPEGSKVTEMALWIDGQRIEHDIKKREDAVREYEEIVRRQTDPLLGEQVADNVFRFRLFPLPPNGERRLEIKYIQPLPAEGGKIKFLLPLILQDYDAAATDSAAIQIDLQTQAAIETIHAGSQVPEENITIEQISTNHYQVQFVEINKIFDYDFVLYFAPGQLPLFTALSYTEPDTTTDGFFLLWATPPVSFFSEPGASRDILLCVDISASMIGDKLSQVKQAFVNILSRLKPEDRFNVLAFNTKINAFKSELVIADAANLAEANNFVRTLAASGLTDLNQAMLSALAMFDNRGHILVISDGQPTAGVTNKNQILANLQNANQQHVQIFPAGIGAEIDRQFFADIALQNSGTAFFIDENENLNDRLGWIYEQITSPVLTGAQISGQGLSLYDVLPQPIGNLAVGSQILQTGRYLHPGTGTLNFAAFNGETTVDSSLTINMSGLPHSKYVARLWAAYKIAELQQQIEEFGENQELVDAIIALSIHYSVLSKYTAFIVVEPTGNNDGWTTAVDENAPKPETFSLQQNYPNPFNPETTIRFSIPVAGLVRLEIYNLLGELVRTLFVGEMNPGEHALVWDGKNERGLVMPSGVYVYKLQAGSFTATRKMILLR